MTAPQGAAPALGPGWKCGHSTSPSNRHPPLRVLIRWMFTRLTTISTTGHSCNTNRDTLSPGHHSAGAAPSPAQTPSVQIPGAEGLRGLGQQLGRTWGSGASLELGTKPRAPLWLRSASGIARQAETRGHSPAGNEHW